MSPKLIALSAAVLLCACGGNSNNTSSSTDAGSNNASNNATNNATNGPNDATNNTTSGSSNNTTASTNNMTTIAPGSTLSGIAVAADFMAGKSSWSTVDADTARTHASVGSPTTFGAGDVAVSHGNAYDFVIDRTNAMIQVLDPADVGTIDVSSAGANPQFATDVGGRVYVTLYDDPVVAVAQKSGAAWSVAKTIDTSSYDAADQNPEASALVADGTNVLVVFQRLQNFMGIDDSSLLVIDSATDAPSGDPIDLGCKNAAAGIRPIPGGGFAVGCTGDYGTSDGGIVPVTKNGESYEAGDFVIGEQALGGDVLDFVFVTQTSGYAVVSLPDFTTKLVYFTIGGAVDDVPGVESPGYAGLAVSADGKWAAVGDRGSAAAIWFLDVTDPTATPTLQAALSLPPAGFAFAP